MERWNPPHRVGVAWKQDTGGAGDPPRLTVRCRAEGSGTAILVEHTGGAGLRAKPREEQKLGWLATEVVAPLLLAIAPSRLVEWSDDRWGRRPSGPTSEARYKEPIYRLPGFIAILEGLALRKHDVLLEVGCGGGALLKRVLANEGAWWLMQRFPAQPDKLLAGIAIPEAVLTQTRDRHRRSLRSKSI